MLLLISKLGMGTLSGEAALLFCFITSLVNAGLTLTEKNLLLWRKYFPLTADPISEGVSHSGKQIVTLLQMLEKHAVVSIHLTIFLRL